MPLPLTVSCFSKIHIGFTFLVPAHLGSPGKRAVKRVCVCVCLRARACVCPVKCPAFFRTVLGSLQVSTVVGRTIDPTDQTTLQDIINMRLDEFIEQFEPIAEAASKEFALEKASCLHTCVVVFCSVLFCSRTRSEGWPHHGLGLLSPYIPVLCRVASACANLYECWCSENGSVDVPRRSSCSCCSSWGLRFC